MRGRRDPGDIMAAMRWLARSFGLAAAALVAVSCTSIIQTTLERTECRPRAEATGKDVFWQVEAV